MAKASEPNDLRGAVPDLPEETLLAMIASGSRGYQPVDEILEPTAPPDAPSGLGPAPTPPPERSVATNGSTEGNGADGSNGVNRAGGSNGVNGASGANSADGADGADGANA